MLFTQRHTLPIFKADLALEDKTTRSSLFIRFIKEQTMPVRLVKAIERLSSIQPDPELCFTLS
jgi:hypothetical protein